MDPVEELPPALRERVVALAAAQLPGLPPDVVPSTVRPFVRFTPTKRARLAAGPLAVALTADPVFRQAVGAAAAAALHRATGPDDAGLPSTEAAALAWLVRGDGWHAQVAEAAVALDEARTRAAAEAESDTVRRLTDQLEALRAAGRAEAERLRGELREATEKVDALRRDLRARGERTARAEATARSALEALANERAALAPALEQARLEVAAARQRAEQAEQAVRSAAQTARTGSRESRATDDLRLRLLLDALLGAATGLRRELALPPAQGRPADAVAHDYPVPSPPETPLQGRAPDDPALLDALLAVPMTHLLVDGYNVTKSGYGGSTLEAQRSRLISGLAALHARTGTEVTVVFDGADQHSPLALSRPRGVRLLFSRTGETADDVLVRLTRLEPPGRPLLVVSDDREVADRCRRSGARPVPAPALLRLLARS